MELLLHVGVSFALYAPAGKHLYQRECALLSRIKNRISRAGVHHQDEENPRDGPAVAWMEIAPAWIACSIYS
eukprot:6975812-Pyramimonas_sp.AAC.1